MHTLYPMYVLPLAELFLIDAVEKLKPHQVLLQLGVLHRFTPGEGRVLFVSHQWLSHGHPDPTCAQIGVLQAALRRLATGKVAVESHPHLQIVVGGITVRGREWKRLLTAPDTYVWLDWFSVPQPSVSSDEQTLADMRRSIRSIPAYVASSAYTIILAPVCPKHDLGDHGADVCDMWSWTRRGWCRLEVTAHAFAGDGSAVAPSLVIEGLEDICFRSPFDALTRPVGLGEFTVPSDRDAIAPVLWRLLNTNMAARRARGDVFGYRWVRALRGHFMRGLPIKGDDASSDNVLHSGERTWAEFAAAYAFRGPRDSLHGYSPLRLAAMSGNVPVMRELLALGADANEVSTLPPRARARLGSVGGDSILASAMQACGGHSSAAAVIDCLLDARADPRCRSRVSYNSVLVEAAAWGNSETLRQLLDGRPDLLAPGIYYGSGVFLTPVIACGVFGQSDPLAVLAAAGAPFGGTEQMSCSALHVAAHFGFSDVVSQLLENSDVLQHMNDVCRPPLFAKGLAVSPRLLHHTGRLLALIGSTNKMATFLTTCIGGTALYAAVATNQVLSVRHLLAAGADPSAPAKYGTTPLQLARKLGGRSTIVELLEYAIARRASLAGKHDPSLGARLTERLSGGQGALRNRAFSRKGAQLGSSDAGPPRAIGGPTIVKLHGNVRLSLRWPAWGERSSIASLSVSPLPSRAPSKAEASIHSCRLPREDCGGRPRALRGASDGGRVGSTRTNHSSDLERARHLTILSPFIIGVSRQTYVSSGDVLRDSLTAARRPV
jgi:ankyrin repeat protein